MLRVMGFHGILVVRDEADFVAECLTHLVTWCDAVYVYDTGSTDATWEIVNEMALRENAIVPLRREPVWYQDGIRAFLFNELRSRFRSGDWVARLDADEVYHARPPDMVRSLGRLETRVHCQMYEFVLTRADIAREAAMPDRRPIVERRRRYYIDPHPELRMFRYRRGMVWLARSYEPYDPGVLARERLAIRHYRGRTPEQLRKRCILRAEMARVRRLGFQHWKVEDWEYWVWRDDDPRLIDWAPGAEMALVSDRRHIRGGWARAREMAYYAAGVPLVRDRLRTRWRGYRPIPIGAEAQGRLQAACAGLAG